VVEPPKRGTGSNLVDVGRAAVRAEPTEGETTAILGHVDRVGGHIEGLRRRCGDAAGCANRLGNSFRLYKINAGGLASLVSLIDIPQQIPCFHECCLRSLGELIGAAEHMM
jgi:hypothetical protein